MLPRSISERLTIILIRVVSSVPTPLIASQILLAKKAGGLWTHSTVWKNRNRYQQSEVYPRVCGIFYTVPLLPGIDIFLLLICFCTLAFHLIRWIFFYPILGIPERFREKLCNFHDVIHPLKASWVKFSNGNTGINEKLGPGLTLCGSVRKISY